MDQPERTELERLKQQQARLEAELRTLSWQLQALERRLAHPPGSEPSVAAPAAPPILRPPTVARPQVAQAPPATVPVAAAVASATVVPPQPGIVPGPAGPSLPPPRQERAGARAGSPRIEAIPLPPPLPAASTEEPGERSFEMRLGTYWLVRIGIVMVLTALVFFGKLAYQNYISQLGPAGKVSLLYLASGTLLAAGWWWQRQSVSDTVRNYAQVLFAGGLAALYFTTYAAHHLEPVRIIHSAAWDGVLLLGCAALMIWAAERKKSEVLAVFAVGLAYYTSIITRVGYFTLWSNLVLCTAAVFFLVRNRWAALSFGSLAGTYAAYGFWRFFNGVDWHWATPGEGLWSGACFLVGYWLIFTSAVFLSRAPKFAGQNRAAFLTLNNGAFFTLFLLTMLQVQHGGFWRFSLVDGGVLMVLAALAQRWLAREPLAANAYLTQGLLLVTVGLISRFAGLQLALILAAESIFLLVAGQQRNHLVLLAGAHLAAALSVGWAIDGLKPFDAPGLWLGAGLGCLMVVNSYLTHRRLIGMASAGAGRPKILLRPQPSYFAVLALVVWLIATWQNTTRANFPPVLAAEALVLTFSIYVLRLREVTLLSQGLVLLAGAAWLANWLEEPANPPAWNPLLVIMVSLALSHWWPRQKVIPPESRARIFWPAAYAVGINLILYLWLAPRPAGPGWLLMTSALGLGLTLYGVATRAWFLAAGGQWFVAVGVVQFAWQIWQGTPPWPYPLAPIAALGLLSLGTVQWFERRPQSGVRVRDPLLEAALVYRWVALVMSLTWICEYIPERERVWVLALVGLGVFLLAGRLSGQEALWFSAGFTGTGLVLFWLPAAETQGVYLPNLLAILALLGQVQIARRWSQRYPMEPGIGSAVILIAGLSLWRFVSRWVLELAGGFYLTASWSVLALALFTAGLLLRERMYRWVGLGVLACALGRVVIFDVWKLETVYRILSLMALGIVLLVLGFLYSKYQEKIKQWL